MLQRRPAPEPSRVGTAARRGGAAAPIRRLASAPLREPDGELRGLRLPPHDPRRRGELSAAPRPATAAEPASRACSRPRVSKRNRAVRAKPPRRTRAPPPTPPHPSLRCPAGALPRQLRLRALHRLRAGDAAGVEEQPGAAREEKRCSGRGRAARRRDRQPRDCAPLGLRRHRQRARAPPLSGRDQRALHAPGGPAVCLPHDWPALSPVPGRRRRPGAVREARARV